MEMPLLVRVKLGPFAGEAIAFASPGPGAGSAVPPAGDECRACREDWRGR